MFRVCQNQIQLNIRRIFARSQSISVANEPCKEFAKGSPERDLTQQALEKLSSTCEVVPCVIGGEEILTGDVRYQVSPYEHQQKVCKYHYADSELINKAINCALSVRQAWERKPLADRVQVLMKAADLVCTTYRYDLLAATMAGQGKSVIQAEIDVIAELADFYRFNCKYAMELSNYELISTATSTNQIDYRGLEGFVAAISPFNFSAIGGNLAATPALMGNVVLWKPSDTAMLSSWLIFKLLRESGIPDGVLNFLPADGPVFGDAVTSSPDLAAINFTGSVNTFRHLWKKVGNNLEKYKTFPRLVGECGGKNYHLVHPTADVQSVINGSVLSAYEFCGQKCSAMSRLYVPESLWPDIKKGMVDIQKQIKVGKAEDFSIFTSAVIDANSFNRIKSYLDHAKKSPSLKVIAGGNCDDSKGYFVEPTILETTDPQERIMQEEIFGPVVTVYVYPDNKFDETVDLVNNTSPFGLTGSLFAKDENVIQEVGDKLKQTCGNFYINDKSTGSIVGQQPFGGARTSGTNDKSGSPYYLLKWTSPQSIKRTHAPLATWKYPHME
ncbi:delta-1-pyrroline-5-carboxylate dehydrogenase, mitochondrial-like [Anneissia japonica]|uniref:delta-1-pyrroline-5-carboxylate dehydrogenase, mitochondrial-like n=1 Tax=Anneissia japonica TaxID=1529436 RepID=UPI001425A275|nr:delta-1-pyrroline-5-carboxylate dehydrogenase, mitochondrial-like [Anneissia japonica]